MQAHWPATYLYEFGTVQDTLGEALFERNECMGTVVHFAKPSSSILVSCMALMGRVVISWFGSPHPSF